LCWFAVGCGEQPAPEAEAPAKPPVAAAPAAPARPAGPLPAIVMSQAQFVSGPDGKPIPGPAKLVVWRTDGTTWWDEKVEDPDSNVFHKTIPWGDGGLLTIGGEKALIRTWSQAGGAWAPTTLTEREWGGKFNRYRDLEIGDLTGDGTDEMALATHDSGWLSVGTQKDGAWTFVEFDGKPDTIVHEVEIGDVDGDGKNEFYATPSERNRSSGESQPGEVVRYDFVDGAYKRSVPVSWTDSHAKEILVTDLGQGDVLFIVVEAHTKKGADGKLEIVDPVRVLRLDPPGGRGGKAKGGAWTEVEVARLDDQQCRFLVPGDVDGDGQIELVAAGMKSGLWVLQPQPDGTFTNELIDANSGGFEHATHVADLDGDGKVEIYVAADAQKEFRRYTWNGTGFSRKVIARIPDQHITWNLVDAKL
jgi:hypothetical protein